MSRGGAGRRASDGRCVAAVLVGRGARRQRLPRPVPAASGRARPQVGALTADALQGAAARAVRLDRAAVGAGQPGGRHREGRLRVRAGPDTHSRRSARWCRTRAAPATARPAPAPSYAEMYGPLLDRRNLLLVDQRGTGRSEPIDCPALQDLKLRLRTWPRQVRSLARRPRRRLHDRAVRRRPRRGDRRARAAARSTSTATPTAPSSPRSSPAAIPSRSAASCSTAPTRRTASPAWYPTQGPAMRHAFDVVCRRSPACRRPGRPFLPTLEQVLAAVRREAVARDGVRRRRPRMRGAASTAPALASVAFGATYTPAFYRELTAALRSGLRGDRAPLLRLVAEATGGGTDAGPVKAYSEGLDAAVACHDYPQLYDMTAPPGRPRERQYAAAPRRAARRTHPGTYGPFTVHEYADSDWQVLDWCTRWPVGAARQPGRAAGAAGRPLPRRARAGAQRRARLDHHAGRGRPGRRPVPERPARRGRATASTSPRSATPTTAPSGSCAPSCASPGLASTRRRAPRVAPVRALGIVPRTLADVSGRRDPRARVARAAALTVADVQDRWWNNYSGHGVGLRGGTCRYTGDEVVQLRLERYACSRAWPSPASRSGTATGSG